VIQVQPENSATTAGPRTTGGRSGPRIVALDCLDVRFPTSLARRLALARDAVGPTVRIAVDANQRWNLAQAIAAIEALAPWDPYWVEEPTSPDEILGLASIRTVVAPIKIAVGEHVARYVSPAAGTSRHRRRASPPRSGPNRCAGTSSRTATAGSKSVTA
jgi:Enolase C-terminal domain-like